MSFSVEKWVQDWDDRIDEWVRALPTGGDEASGREAIERAADTIMTPKTRVCYTGTGEKGIVYHAMPEPYIGNPLAAVRGEQPLHGVLLTLNPGQVVYSHQALYDPEDKYAPGEYIERIRNGEIYSQIVRDSTRIPEATSDFWLDKAFPFIDRVTGDKAGHTSIDNAVGIDLWPWHSYGWKAFPKSRLETAKQWGNNRVFKAVFQLARASRLSKIYNQYRSGSDWGLFLSMGKDNRVLLSQLGFDVIWRIDPYMKNTGGEPVNEWVPDFVQTKCEWPKNDSGNHTQNRFIWMEHKELSLVVLVKELNAMCAPSDKFTDFLHAVISDPSLQDELREWYAENKNDHWPSS